MIVALRTYSKQFFLDTLICSWPDRSILYRAHRKIYRGSRSPHRLAWYAPYVLKIYRTTAREWSYQVVVLNRASTERSLYSFVQKYLQPLLNFRNYVKLTQKLIEKIVVKSCCTLFLYRKVLCLIGFALITVMSI